MKRVVILQARLDSSRLPQKVLLQLKGVTVLEHVVERIKQCKDVDEICAAIPEDVTDDALLPILEAMGVKVSRGSNEDVLSRFIVAGYESGADIIVRTTADNPLLHPACVDQEIEFICANPVVDYVSMQGLPLGTWVEAFPLKTLEKIDYLTKDLKYREHVTLYLRENPSRFNIVDLPVPLPYKFPDLRLTLDTIEDYELFEEIYKTLFQSGKVIELIEVLDLIRENPSLRTINSNIRQVPWPEVVTSNIEAAKSA